MDWKHLRNFELQQGGFVMWQGPDCALCGLPTPSGKQATDEGSPLVLCVVCTGEDD